ncbi:hypothetical protein R1flu_020503 [Riccia fluitans]|uniref:sphingosine kinase n=1 Tax=Riccia fluitans TaxID=41844 RepID=A0ABD1ZM26_9MARC
MDTINESVLLDGQKVTATISISGLLQWAPESFSWHKDAKGAVDLRDDVIGYSVGSSSIIIHTFNEKAVKCWAYSPKRVERDITLVFGNPDAHQVWCNALQRFYANAGRPKRLLVLVNPFGGKNKAVSVYHKTVEPLFKKAGIDVTVRETQFHRHAKELAKSIVLSEYDGVVCVSGDGVLTEVLNGLLERPDWEQAIKMPLGIIPAGTGNGMAKSLLEAGNEYYNQANAAFSVIRGCKQPLDVASVVQGHVKCHSLLMLSWGFVADVDFESEKLRALGNLRIDLWAVLRVIWLREYTGSLAYIPAAGSDSIAERFPGQEQSLLGRSGEDHSSPENEWKKDNNWRTVEGKFIYIWAQNVPYASEEVIPAPGAKFNDGCFDLMIIRQCPRLKLVSILLNMKNGDHIKSKYVQYLKVKAFRLTPGRIVGDSVERGYVDLDGEVLARGQGAYGDGSHDPMHYGPTIDVHVEKGMATIFAPPRCRE